MIKLAMNKSTKNVLIATLPTVLTYTVGKVVRAISKRYHCKPGQDACCQGSRSGRWSVGPEKRHYAQDILHG